VNDVVLIFKISASGALTPWRFDGQFTRLETLPGGLNPATAMAWNVAAYHEPYNAVLLLAVNGVGAGGTGGVNDGDVRVWAYRYQRARSEAR
jgi:hypothetical protein